MRIATLAVAARQRVERAASRADACEAALGMAAGYMPIRMIRFIMRCRILRETRCSLLSR